MIQILQIKGKDKQLYELLAPLVMDPEVIRANNNYPFKTGEEFVWFVAIEEKAVVGFVPVEQRSPRKALINNYYVHTEAGDKRKEILSQLLRQLLAALPLESGQLESVTLVQDKETFEEFEFASMNKKWTRYVKMHK